MEAKSKGSKRMEDREKEKLTPRARDRKEARDEIVTEDIRWIERATQEGLPVEFEIGRRSGIPRKERVCECGRALGTGEHMVERCKIFDVERRIAKIKLKELGMKRQKYLELHREGRMTHREKSGAHRQEKDDHYRGEQLIGKLNERKSSTGGGPKRTVSGTE